MKYCEIRNYRVCFSCTLVDKIDRWTNIYLINNIFFFGLKVFNFDLFMFFCSRNARVRFAEKSQSKIIIFRKHKHWYLIHICPDKFLKDILTVLLSVNSFFFIFQNTFQNFKTFYGQGWRKNYVFINENSVC